MYLVLLELLFPLFLSLFLSPFFLTSGIAGIFYLHFQYVGFCRPQNIGKTQKPRCRQRQRGSKTKKGTNTTANPSYVLRKFFFLISCIYYTRCFGKRKFLSDFFSLAADDDNRHSMQHPAAGTIFVSWYPESCIPPAAFCRPPPLYTSKRSLTPAIVLLDRPVLSRPPYLLYRANLRLPFANNPSFQAPSAPATTFQEP